MRRWRTVCLSGFLVGLVGAPLAIAEEARRVQASAQRARGALCAASARNTSTSLAGRLQAGQVAAGLAAPLQVELSAEELAAANSQPSGERRYRVGLTQSVHARVGFFRLRPADLSATPVTLPLGAIRGIEGGGFVWTGAVESPQAAAVRLRFVNFFLPRHAELFLYSDSGEVFGPYSGRGPHGDGEFWSHTLRGSKVIVQLHYGGQDTARALRATRLVIADVGHLTPKFLLALFGSPGAQDQESAELCSFNAPCVVNPECSIAMPAAIQSARNAIAQTQFVSGAFLYLCSGGLVADTDSGSDIPYFLTANHCLSKDREARSLEAYFQFVTSCGGACDLTGSVPRTRGASIVATHRSSDYTLLRLDEAAPAGSSFLGWDSQEVASRHGVDLYRISHPAGAPQAYSEHTIDTSKPTCTSWPRGAWIYSHDLLGATEGGSSGSPVLDAQGRLVGQLSGGCGYDVHNVCNADANATVDGAFAAYFQDVAPYLNPSSSCTDGDGDGSCAEDGDCNDGDPAIYPGAAEVCDDSLDNDCDGLVDGADSSCQTGGCDLAAVGASCSSDGDCCSDKCRGKPGAKRCR